MGLTAKPVGKLASVFRKLDNELAKKAAENSFNKEKKTNK